MAHENPTERQPKGDHNRRIALKIDPDAFAAEAGITTEQLREYEFTSFDHRFDPEVARRVGETLDRLEAVLPNFETTRATPAPGASTAQVGKGEHTQEDRYDGNENAKPRYVSGGEAQTHRETR